MSSPTIQQPYDGLSEEIRAYWRRLPDKTLFFGLLLAWAALFHFLGNSSFGYVPTTSLFEFMAVAYNAETLTADDGHGNLIPFLVLGILWWKRDDLVAKPLHTWWPAIFLILLGLLAHIVGYVVQQQRLSIVGLFVGLYGLTGLVWGPNWLKATLFPFVLFAFMVPLGSLTEKITFPLRLMVTWIVEHLFNDLFGVGVIRVGTQLFNPLGTYQYEVAAACGGMRSLIAIFLISVTYGFLVFRSPWKRLVMVGASLPLAVIGNVVRLSFIVAAGEIGGQQGQDWGNYVHDSGFFSMLPYVPAIIGVMYIGKYLENTEPPSTTTSSAKSQ
jgi:Transmembrane exosortase (Exosortase_EpsH).